MNLLPEGDLRLLKFGQLLEFIKQGGGLIVGFGGVALQKRLDFLPSLCFAFG